MFDHGAPAPLRNRLLGHDIDLAKECGLETMANGRLLKAAEASGYNVFVTTDKSIPFQHKLAGAALAVVIIPANWPQVEQRLPLVRRAIDQTPPGKCVVVSETEIHAPRAKKGSPELSDCETCPPPLFIARCWDLVQAPCGAVEKRTSLDEFRAVTFLPT